MGLHSRLQSVNDIIRLLYRSNTYGYAMTLQRHRIVCNNDHVSEKAMVYIHFLILGSTCFMGGLTTQ